MSEDAPRSMPLDPVHDQVDGRRSASSELWPAWFGPAGFALALVLTSLVVVMIAAVASGLAGVEAGAPVLALIGVFVQDTAFVAVAVGLAATTRRPRAADFGLRTLPLKRLAAATVIGALGFFAFVALYGLLVAPEGSQDTLTTLGTGRSSTLLLGGGAAVILLAPLAEEIFFRGFFYRAMRNRFSTASAVTISALLFGSIHYTGPETLSLLPILAVLGAVFCLLYEWTGSLYPAIALHVLNNALTFGASSEGSVLVGAAMGAFGLVLCAGLSRARTGRRVASARP